MQQNETLGLADLTKEFYKLYNLMIAWTSNFKYWCLKLRQKNKTTYSDPWLIFNLPKKVPRFDFIIYSWFDSKNVHYM